MTFANNEIPEPTVRRLSAYLRQLEDLAQRGVSQVSSRQLAEHLDAGADMVRRDLSMFGQFGRPGRGYEVPELLQALRVILGTQRQWNVVVVGAGNLGRALLQYPDFLPRGFHLVAAVDTDPDKIGRKVGGIEIRDDAELEQLIHEREIRLAILTVPPAVAVDIARRLAAAGVQGILNFATSVLPSVDGVYVDHVDISSYLEYLSFRVSGLRP